MKYFFIHKSKPIGTIFCYKDQLAFITKEADLKKVINSNKEKEYLKIPTFKTGDKIKIGQNAPTRMWGKEFSFVRLDADGRIHVVEQTDCILYITDIQTI